MPQPRLKTPFEYTGGNLCLDFANTINYWAEPDLRKELITDYPRLLQWAEESGAISRKTAEDLRELAADAPGNAQSALRSAIQLRDIIYNIFAAIAHRRGIPSTALAGLNKAVQRAFEHAQISHANRHFAWEWVLPERSLDTMLWPVARAAADLLTSDDLPLVRQCASEDCAWLFLDKSKNHRRRWCDMKICGNRNKARRYYQRQKAG
ncbi:MAG TPA: ABATE domain-containing protein [Terriglobales bacterium]|nr:ABATE domain-containing protein [Terriglobales bacterium]